jgi:serine/threonine protein kinase
MHETLKTYLERNKGNLSPDRVMEICSAVCEGLSHLHGLKNPLIHRDLSNKNVLLTKDGIVKIADFGQAKLLGDLKDTLQTTQPGTVLYMPPEVLVVLGEENKREKERKKYTAKVDSFSLGVLMLEICTQSPPSSSFGGIGTIEEVKRREDDLRLLDDAHLLKPLIVWCLQYEELRPTVAGIHNHVTSYPRQIAHLKDKLDAANGETARLRKLLDVTEEKLRNQFLQVEKITGELEVSTEETNGLEQGLKELQEKCQFLQEQVSYSHTSVLFCVSIQYG